MEVPNFRFREQLARRGPEARLSAEMREEKQLSAVGPEREEGWRQAWGEVGHRKPQRWEGVSWELSGRGRKAQP